MKLLAYIQVTCVFNFYLQLKESVRIKIKGESRTYYRVKDRPPENNVSSLL
uniref:Uncharacterized protein n=1 Tax=Anguilla anguilla TaxID=7936 RepID=A0A0E9XJU7_ANGAN